MTHTACLNFKLSKRTYRSFAAAEKERIKIASKGQARYRKNGKSRLYPFHCPHCGMWHLTSREQKKP